MTRWRVVRCPRGSHAALSDRQPGPMVGAWGDLRGWVEVYHDPGWLTFEAACQLAATGNGKPSTANMGPREGGRERQRDLSDNEHGESTMPDHGLAYPADRMRGHRPNAREWSVCRGDHPGSHYATGAAWADNHCAPWIVTRGLTLAEAMAHMRVLNQAAGGGPGAGDRLPVRSGGRG